MSKELLYSPLGTAKGFTSSKLSDRQSIELDRPIRELLQNSFDAASEGVIPEVVFHIDKVKLDEVPFLDDYKNILDSSISFFNKMSGGINQQSQQVIDNIKEYVKKPEIDVLTVTDNGEGFNSDRIESLFREASNKNRGESSSGSFGQGHLTAYGLSGLRYVLYWGHSISSNNTKEILFTGAAILAGHRDAENNYEREEQSIILSKPPKDERSRDYSFISNNKSVPNYLLRHVDPIKSTGSAVSILGLNKKWDSTARYSIASNFFLAICEGLLKVSVEEAGQKSNFKQDVVVSTLREFRDKKNISRKHKVTVVGSKAWRAYEVYTKVKKEIISLDENNKVTVYFDDSEPDDGVYIKAILRNGMWITSDLPLALNDLEHVPGKKEFSILITIHSSECPDFHSLLKRAETPMHDAFHPDQLGNDMGQLSKYCDLLKKGIIGLLSDVEFESFDLPLFELEFGQNSNMKKSGYRRPTSTGIPEKPNRPGYPVKTDDIDSPEPNPDPLPPKPNPMLGGRSIEGKLSYGVLKKNDNRHELFIDVYPDPKHSKDYTSIALGIADGSDDGIGNLKAEAQIVDVYINGELHNLSKTEIDSKIIEVGLLPILQKSEIKIAYTPPSDLEHAIIPTVVVKQKSKIIDDGNQKEQES